MAEALAAHGGSVPAVEAALRRAVKRGEIASPYRGFYVVVPPEYRRLGCLPPEQFIPQLLKYLGEPYYVALLSAAEMHGAAHQRPQRFQVMVPENQRPIKCGDVRIQFVARHDLERTPVQERYTPRGPRRVSSPEATALELVGYADQCGGLDNVASVLAELAESIRAKELFDAARLCPIARSQRLGYLLERTGGHELAVALERHVQEQAPTLAPLVRARPITADDRFEGRARVPGGTGQVAVTATDPSGNLRTNLGRGEDVRVTAVKEGAATVASYAYNKDGIRTGKSAGGVTTHYVLEGSSVVEERLSTGAIRK